MEPWSLKKRIVPTAPWREWPLTRIVRKSGAYTIATSITGLPLLRFFGLVRKRKVLEQFVERFDGFEAAVAPIYRTLGIPEEIAFLRAYVDDPANVPDGSDQEQRYVAVLKHYDRSQSHSAYRDALSAMIENPDIVRPDGVAEHDFGAWDPTFRNAVARRAVDTSLSIPLNDLAPILWSAFRLPHGLDSVRFDLSHLPIHFPHPEVLLQDIAGLLAASYYEFAPEITDHPLYRAAPQIAEKRRGYTGVEHAEAAALLADQHQDPLGAWNALVSAAFWAGLSQEDEALQVTLWDQAIWLCEKEGWTDAHTVLVHQREVYRQASS